MHLNLYIPLVRQLTLYRCQVLRLRVAAVVQECGIFDKFGKFGGIRQRQGIQFVFYTEYNFMIFASIRSAVDLELVNI